jgi:F420-dependent oxidoreductase-like protein
MRIGMSLSYAGGFRETVDELADYEKAGLDIVFVPEAYSFDAVSQMGFIAARTERLQIASGILQIYSRTPTLTAMTAAGLDYVSGGRFTLGIGASGPQVIEGWHGVPYTAPIGRTREIIEICRKVWKRERLVHEGKNYQLPLPADQGTGLGKPLKLINHPVRERIPILIASLGPKNVEMTAELAEGWEPIFYLPEKAGDVWGEALAKGRAKRDPSLGELDVVAQASLAIGDDVEGYLEFGRPLHRRHGRQGQELLQRSGPPLRLREGGRGDPGPLPRRQEGRGRRQGPVRPPPEDLPHRHGGLRPRPRGRPEGVRRHHPQRQPHRRRPRRPREAHREDPGSGRVVTRQ